MTAVFPPPIVDHVMLPEPVDPPRRTGRGWVLAAAVVAVLAVGVGGLFALTGSGEEAAAAPYSLAAAAAEAAEADTVEFAVTVTAGALGEFTLEGAVDHEAQLVVMAMDLGETLGLGSAGSVDVILDAAGGVLYFGADDLGEVLPVESEWISMDLATIAEMSGQSLEDLQDEFVFDPTAAAALLLDEGDAVEVGREEIDGEAVAHYQVTVDLAEVLAANPQVQQQLDESGLDADTSLPEEIGLPEEITYDVWVTEDSELRRLSFEFPVMGEVLRTQLDMHSVGEPLGVEVPTGGDVVDLTELFGL